MKVELCCEKEIIVVNDGSTDRSGEICRKFDNVALIEHKLNMGKGAAVQTGIKNSSGDIVLIQDADLEYFPEDIPRLVNPILEGRADVVLGSRFLGEPYGMSKSHTVGNKILTDTTRLLYRHKITDVMTGYKAFRKELLRDISLESKDFSVETELVAKLLEKKCLIIETPIRYKYRQTGRSKISWKHGFKSLWTLLRIRFARISFRPSVLVFLFYLLYVIGILSVRNFDPTSFIYIGTNFLSRDPEGPVTRLVREVGFGPPYWDVGYDGQMYYYLALDPLNAWRIFDTTARYQRILYPLIVRLVTFGVPRLIPYALIAVNLIAITLGTEVADRLLRLTNHSPWYALSFGLYIGQLLALRHDTAEPLAYMLILAAVYVYEKKHDFNLSSLFFALSLFAKETAIFFAGGYLLGLVLVERRPMKEIAKFSAFVLLPYSMYQLFLLSQFGILPILTVGVAGYFRVIPFFGVYAASHELPELFNMTFLILIPSLLSCLIFIKQVFSRDLHLLSFALLFNAVFMIFLPSPTYVSVQSYSRVSMGLATSFLLYGILARKTWVLTYCLVWILPLSTYFTYVF